MKIFLTGHPMGQSALIQQFLKKYPQRICGYEIYSHKKDESTDFYMHAWVDVKENDVLFSKQLKTSNVVFEQVFETFGIEVLKKSREQKDALLILDEIGHFEGKKDAFLNELLMTIQTHSNILGVIGQCDVGYIQEIKEMNDVRILDLDEIGFDRAKTRLDELFVMETNRTSYNSIVDWWSKNRKGRSIDACILEWKEQYAMSSILDLGCGSGEVAHALSQPPTNHYIGIDSSEKMIEKAKAYPDTNAQFICINMLDYKPNQKFDGILAFDSLFHLPITRQKEMLIKSCSWLEIGGTLMLTHGKKHSEVKGEMENQPFYYSALDVDEVIDILQVNGCEIIDCKIDYKSVSTGTRDLLIIAQKKS